ncbi:MAG: ACT domain-containing protein [Planctomycetes bacterium]|nr:ACT domain-containing protein [Planctomycetota bacterium]
MTDAARDLDEALARMTWEVVPGRYALVGDATPPRAEELALLAAGPGQLVVEGGETTWLLPEAALDALLAARPDARVERGVVWIRFVAPMGWDVVGFLARVTSALAAADVPLGAVCGFSRDHLFLHERWLARARDVLTDLFPDRTT